jgi:G3E family GTPase
MSPPRGIPLIVLTGFLGSGKTSLLNRWLRSPELRDTAVLINEFGEIGLDHQLVETLDDAPILLANGCVCCSIRDDLKAALLKLEARRLAGEVPGYKRVIIETTGAADPAPILATLLGDPELRHHYHLGSVVTVVDAVNGLSSLGTYREAQRQAALADFLLLSKCDLVTPAALDALRVVLREFNPAAVIDEAIDVAVPPGLEQPETRDALRIDWLRTAELPSAHHHAETFGSFTLILEQSIDWTAFGVWLSLLLHVHGQRILRVKGLLRVQGSERPVVVNGVQHLVHPPYHLAAWPDEDQRSRLVFITEGVSREEVANSLAVFNALGLQLRSSGADSSP